MSKDREKRQPYRRVDDGQQTLRGSAKSVGTDPAAI